MSRLRAVFVWCCRVVTDHGCVWVLQGTVRGDSHDRRRRHVSHIHTHKKKTHTDIDKVYFHTRHTHTQASRTASLICIKTFCATICVRVCVLSLLRSWLQPELLRFTHDEAARHEVMVTLGIMALNARPGDAGMPLGHITTYKVRDAWYRCHNKTYAHRHGTDTAAETRNETPTTARCNVDLCVSGCVTQASPQLRLEFLSELRRRTQRGDWVPVWEVPLNVDPPEDQVRRHTHTHEHARTHTRAVNTHTAVCECYAHLVRIVNHTDCCALLLRTPAAHMVDFE